MQTLNLDDKLKSLQFWADDKTKIMRMLRLVKTKCDW